MSEQTIDLKGSLFTLSVLHLSEDDLPRLKSKLKAKIAQAPGFFYRAPVVVNIDKLQEIPLNFSELVEIISSMDLVLVGICGGSAEQKVKAKEAGLAVLSQGKEPQAQATEAPQQPSPQVVERVVEKVVERTVETPVFKPAVEIKRNIRSGQQVYAKGTDLIILGSVGNGAEVIADGNIHVYGTLRGRAIAGASGNKDARIYCQNLKAELVSISGNFMMSESLQDKLWDKAANIALSDEKLIISELN